MKKDLIISILFGFTLFSCKKEFIELTPEDQYSAATFYKTESNFRQAVIAAYVPLRSLVNSDFYTSEMRSDNTHYEFNQGIAAASYVYRENLADFTNTPSNTYSNNVYFDCYSGISKANIVIERLPSSEVEDPAKTEIDGQAKFLRAFYYFRLARYFGGVPLYLTEVKNADDAFVERSSIEEVYNQILSDAKDAVNELKPPAKFPQSGEATKGSATVLLADVYITLKKYPEAEALLKSLASMGYGLNANYADAFSPGNKNSKESLFEVQYLGGTASGSQPSNFIYVFLPRSTNTSLLTEVKTNNSGSGGWNTPTEDLINAYEPDDERLDASIGIAEGVYNASSYLTISANKSVVNYTPSPGKVGVPYIKKYLHPPYTDPNNTDENWPIYRYSDALLLLAEAQNEQGESPLVSLNAVRERAGLAPITETDQSLLRNIILHERRVELAFEDHRWFDLIRSGKAVEVMNAFGEQQKQKYYYLGPETYHVTAEKLLYPIPESEIGLNPELTQNPGY